MNKELPVRIPVCEECQTQSLKVEASAIWSVEENNWVLYDVGDVCHCQNEDCDTYEENEDVFLDWVAPEEVKYSKNNWLN